MPILIIDSDVALADKLKSDVRALWACDQREVVVVPDLDTAAGQLALNTHRFKLVICAASVSESGQAQGLQDNGIKLMRKFVQDSKRSGGKVPYDVVILADHESVRPFEFLSVTRYPEQPNLTRMKLQHLLLDYV